MVLNIHVNDNLSFFLPVTRTLNDHFTEFLLSADTNSASLLKPGLNCTLFSNEASDITRLKEAQIQSVETSDKGYIVKI